MEKLYIAEWIRRVQEDYDVILQACRKALYCPFYNFTLSLDRSVVTFDYKFDAIDENTVKFCIVTTPQYPEGTTVTSIRVNESLEKKKLAKLLEDNTESYTSDDPLLSIFSDIVESYYPRLDFQSLVSDDDAPPLMDIDFDDGLYLESTLTKPFDTLDDLAKEEYAQSLDDKFKELARILSCYIGTEFNYRISFLDGEWKIDMKIKPKQFQVEDKKPLETEDSKVKDFWLEELNGTMCVTVSFPPGHHLTSARVKVTREENDNFVTTPVTTQLNGILQKYLDERLGRDIKGDYKVYIPEEEQIIERYRFVTENQGGADIAGAIRPKLDFDIGLEDEAILVINVYLMAILRAPFLKEHCVVCDKRHPFSDLTKPLVCNRPLCEYSYQTLGVGCDVEKIVRAWPEEVDLLVHMLRTSARSFKHKKTTQPYPLVVDPNNRHLLAFDPKKPDFGKLNGMLRRTPLVRQMLKMPHGTIKKELDRRHPFCYPLLQWIVGSNRSYLRKLTTTERLRFMVTQHQYFVQFNTPEKEDNFQTLKKTYGSVLAFHGSGSDNWHSILRRGLIIASNTKHMVNGAAHGFGIYISPRSNTSISYSIHGNAVKLLRNLRRKRRQRWGPSSFYPPINLKRLYRSPSRFIRSTHPVGVALCEVINGPALKRPMDDVWLCTDPAHIAVRFFFVYESEVFAHGVSIRADDDKFMSTFLDVIGKSRHTQITRD